MISNGEITYLIHICYVPYTVYASLVVQRVKRLPAMPETWVQPLGREDPLENKWQPILVFLPWMEDPGRLQFMGSQRVGHDWATSLHFTSLCLYCIQGFPCGLAGKESACNAGDLCLILG